MAKILGYIAYEGPSEIDGAPPAPLPTPEAIDAAMLADKLADRYFQRQINNAINLELRYASPEN